MSIIIFDLIKYKGKVQILAHKYQRKFKTWNHKPSQFISQVITERRIAHLLK